MYLDRKGPSLISNHVQSASPTGLVSPTCEMAYAANRIERTHDDETPTVDPTTGPETPAVTAPALSAMENIMRTFLVSSSICILRVVTYVHILLRARNTN